MPDNVQPDKQDRVSRLVQNLEEIRGYAETLLAVERLEYHDKNWLSGSSKSRSEHQQELLELVINLAGDT